ncbi:MAG: hypothetical protein ABJM98_05920, partial [Ekhidna sp.]
HWWAHITPISQYPTAGIPFQHGTPQSTMDIICRVSEYNQHPPYSLYTTILISPLLLSMINIPLSSVHENVRHRRADISQ